MLANIIIGVVLMFVLPCKSQNQKFFEVPFDEEVQPTPKLQQPHHFIPVDELPLQQSFENRNVQTGTKNNFFNNRQPQQRVHHQGFRTNLDLTGSTNQQQFENFSPNQDLIVEQQPNIFKQPQEHPVHHSQQASRNKKNKQRVADSIPVPSDPLPQPVNTYVNVEEPTLTLIDQVESKPIPTNSFQTRSQFPSTFRHHQQISQRPTINQFQTNPQFIQPQIVSNVPHIAQRAQEPHYVIQQKQTIAQIPQVHTPRIHRPQVEQPSFFINIPPSQAKLPAHRFVNQRPQHQNSLRTSNVQNTRDREEEIFRQQAENAKYSFSSQIDDNINGNQHEREEVRDGVAVKGRFAYSDGFVRRIVHYEADDKGYRVVKEEEEPLGNGPRFNPKGQANVSSFVAGNALQYSITSDDIQKKELPPLETRTF